MIEIRNAAYNRHGSIDCEINHPVYGWIPFTASPHDPAGKSIYEDAVAGEVAPYVEPDPVVIVPTSVSARQFKLQLLAAGLLDQVEAWVATQDRAVQIAYANSATFVRADPMMQAGFADLGFTEQQIDAFFVAASEL